MKLIPLAAQADRWMINEILLTKYQKLVISLLRIDREAIRRTLICHYNKHLWFIVAIVGIYLSLFSINAFGESLVKIVTMKDGSGYYYDKDSMKRISGTVRVWTVERLKGKSMSDYNKALQETYPTNILGKLSHTKTLHEMNCKERRYRFLMLIYYDVEGRVLETLHEETPWGPIIPGSMSDGLRGHVCK
jgi:hypothetical protein